MAMCLSLSLLPVSRHQPTLILPYDPAYSCVHWGAANVDRVPYAYVRYEQHDRHNRAYGRESGAWRQVRKIKVHSE